MNTKGNTKTSDLPKIGMPATNALANIGITTLKQVSKLSEKELLAIHGVGPKAVRILKEAFKEVGLSFKE
jgi:predicted flap endonuclease-1-like 5' DNA nuclease